MRIPFPERVPINRVAIFAVVLFAIQVAEGTTLYFSVGCVVFILIAAFAFNAAGGLTRASGAYVFIYSVLVVLIGLCYKAFLGEPAQSNLVAPQTDIEVYVAGITGLYAAVIISRRFSRPVGLIQFLLKEDDMQRASVGCLVAGVSGVFAIALLGESGAKVQSAFAQLNELIPLGIIIGVMYEIRRSGGTRCTNLFVTLGTAYFFFLGITSFSKQGMLTPFYCWLLPVCALRYRLSAAQILSCLLAVFIVFHYLVPFSQYGRGQVQDGATLSQRLEIALPLLEHADETRRLYLESQEGAPTGLNSYFDTPQGFWERLQFISVDDKLNAVTDQGKVYGLLPIKLGFINAIPHVLWPNKPGGNFGAAYTREINGEAEEEGDLATGIGIAFSPTGEAYHLAQWTGVLVIAPLLWCTLFIIFDSLLGDLRKSPWGLLAFAMISHIGPEDGIVGTIYLFTLGTEVLVFCAFFTRWLAPIFAIPILGPDRRTADRTTLSSEPSTPVIPSVV